MEKFGPESAVRVSHWNGGDIETKQGRELIKRQILEKRPLLVWISPECGPYSPMQNLNQRTPQQKQALESKRDHARLQYEGAAEVAMFAKGCGCDFVIELSERCAGWHLPWHENLTAQTQTYSGVCKGCQVGLKDHQGTLLGKGWRMCSSNEELIRHMSLSCPGNHVHAPCEGSKVCRQSAFYTKSFANRVMEHIKKSNGWEHVLLELQDGFSNAGPHMYAHGSVEHGFAVSDGDDMSSLKQKSQPLSREETTRIMNCIRRIHSATGHCSKDYLKKALKKRNVKPEILDLVDKFHCPTCHEFQKTVPRNKASLVEIHPKWSHIQGDCGDWQHPETGETWQFLLVVDEGCRFRLGKCLGSGKKLSPSAQDLINFYETQWYPCFGKPHVVRVDPAGAFRSTKVDSYFGERQVLVETIPAEAHWQISIVERSIQTTKGMLTKLSKEFPDMRFEELLARSLSGHKTLMTSISAFRLFSMLSAGALTC